MSENGYSARIDDALIGAADARRLTEHDFPRVLAAVHTGLRAVVRGKEAALQTLLLGVLAGGHVLLEDVPGVGKTTLAKALAKLLGVQFSRVQCTPDLLPQDVTGSLILNAQTGTFTFSRGPVFTNVLLADEVNRASPRTQSALLEAMSEAQVTVDGTTHALPRPFIVLATQNPESFQGTYPLPEAQLDRFLLRISIGYPPAEEEVAMLFDRQNEDPITKVQPCASGDDLATLQCAVRAVQVKQGVASYMVALVHATRNHGEVTLGCSPRASLALFRAAQAHAFTQARAYVSPDDVQFVAVPCLAHRLVLKSGALEASEAQRSVMSDLVKRVAVPT